MRERMRLDAAKVKSLKARPNERRMVQDTIFPGLMLDVTTRSKTWRLRFRKDGQRLTVKLGMYPDLSLADARKAADAMREGEESQDAAPPEDQGQPAVTVSKLFEEYTDHLEKVKNRSEGHVRDTRNRLYKGRYSFLKYLERKHGGDLPVSSVTPAMCSRWMNEVYRRAPQSACHYRTSLNSAFEWATKADNDFTRDNMETRYGLSVNPVASLPPAEPPGVRSVMVTPEALQRLWPHLKCDPVTKLLIRTVFAMGGVRALQFARLEKAWVRDGWIYWPADSTKTDKEHVLPLTRRAKELVTAALVIAPENSPYVFPSPDDPMQPLTASAISRAMARTIDHYDIEPHFVLKDWRRTVKTAGLERGLFTKEESDKWHLHCDKDVSEKHYTFAEFREPKLKVAAAVDLLVDEWLGVAQEKAA